MAALSIDVRNAPWPHSGQPLTVFDLTVLVATYRQCTSRHPAIEDAKVAHLRPDEMNEAKWRLRGHGLYGFRAGSPTGLTRVGAIIARELEAEGWDPHPPPAWNAGHSWAG